MPPADGLPISAQALDEAAHWFVVLASGEASDAELRSWHAWRAAHPSHEQAWQRAENCTARLTELPRTQARASLQALSQLPVPKSPARRKALVQMGVLLAAGVAGWQGYRASDWSADLVTSVGEQRDLTLPDGSRLLLDTNSAVDLEFTQEQRVIRLRRGRIMIATAPDHAARARPFAVDTLDGRVRALGTRFTVQQEPRATFVSVLEARVALRGSDAGGAETVLGAGRAARFNRSGLIEQRAVPATDSAWLTGMLIADDMRLGELIAQLARYRTVQLACDPAAATLRISGVFPLLNTELALAAIGRTLPIHVERRQHGNAPASLLVRKK